MPYGMLASASLKRKPQRRAAWQGGILSAIGNNRSIEGGHEYEENAMDLRAGPADKSPADCGRHPVRPPACAGR